MTAPPPGRPAGLLATLRRRAHPADAVVLLFVPAVLVGVYSLPEPTRQALVFSHATPTPLAAYATHFVHLEATHLYATLAAYGLVVPATYLLCTVAGRRRAFYVVFTAILSAFPPVLSWLSLLAFDFGRLLGFSGLVMAFVGFLPLALFEHLHAQFRGLVGLNDSPGLFFLGIALIAALTPLRITRLIAVGVAVIALAYLALNVRRLLRNAGELDGSVLRRGYAELGALGVVVFVVSIVGAFPADPTTGTAVINLYVHLLGYSLGYIAAYTTLVVSRGLSAPPFFFR